VHDRVCTKTEPFEHHCKLFSQCAERVRKSSGKRRSIKTRVHKRSVRHRHERTCSFRDSLPGKHSRGQPDSPWISENSLGHHDRSGYSLNDSTGARLHIRILKLWSVFVKLWASKSGFRCYENVLLAYDSALWLLRGAEPLILDLK